MIYQSTPDYYNDFISHASHKYLRKYKNQSGRWVYVYERPKLSDLPNPYVALNEGMNSLHEKKNAAIKSAKKATVRGLGKAAASAVRTNNRFNSYMNKKTASAYNSAASKTRKKYNQAVEAAKPYASAAKKTYDDTVESYNKYKKKRKQVAAGKKLIKQHTIAKRTKKRAESDVAVYTRALKDAYKTVKRRHSK